MKLLTQTILVYLLLSVLIVGLATPLLYRVVYQAVLHETTEILRHRKKDIRKKLKSLQSPQEIELWQKMSDDIDLELLPNGTSLKDSIYTTERTVGKSIHPEPFCEIRGTVKIGTQLYLFRARASMVESNELVQSIVQSQLYLLVALLAGLLLMNWLLSKHIWTAFYGTVNRLKNYDISQKNLPDLPKSSITEFQTLNEVIGRMMHKISSDYQSLKQFTENASHEIQTPLAVMTNRLEMMMQDTTLTQEQLENLHTSYAAANRLSRLNQGLLLLTKIENRQFTAHEIINLKDALEEKMNWLQEWIEQKQLQTQITLTPTQLSMNPMLAQILVSNLLGNAIRHNLPGGTLLICLTSQQLRISNSGIAPQTDPMAFFERFHKAQPHSESLGLGLAIVWEICTLYAFTISYTYTSDLHTITVDF